MSESFDPNGRAIPLQVRLHGASGLLDALLALDTGATRTVISTDLLMALGYDPSAADTRVFVSTVGGTQHVPKVVLTGIEAIGLYRPRFPVLAARLPPTVGFDGLLGLDFLRGRRLTVDFRKGVVRLT